MVPVVWSVKCSSGAKILGSDPQLTFCVAIIRLTKFHACALKWGEKARTDLTMFYCAVSIVTRNFAMLHCTIKKITGNFRRLYCAVKIVTRNFPKLYFCKDNKNVKRDKKFLRSRFLIVVGALSAPSWKIRSFLRWWKYKTLFKFFVFLFISWAQIYFLKYKRNITVESSIPWSVRKLRYDRVLNISILKYKKSSVKSGFFQHFFVTVFFRKLF